MIARIRKMQEEKEGGFTLIELLVVMIIIGILAAIAIPVFLSQKNKAKDTSAKSDVSVIGKELAAYYVDGTSGVDVYGPSNNWTFASNAGTTGSLLSTAPTANQFDSGKLSSGNSISKAYTSTANGGSYCVDVTSGSNAAANIYQFSSTNGLTGPLTTSSSTLCSSATS